jgi:hypothetical protein
MEAQIHFVMVPFSRLSGVRLVVYDPTMDQLVMGEANLRVGNSPNLRDYEKVADVRWTIPGSQLRSLPPNLRPIGLVRAGHKEFSARTLPIGDSFLDSLFCLSDTNAEIIEIRGLPHEELLEKFASMTKFRDCIQTGPILIEKSPAWVNPQERYPGKEVKFKESWQDNRTRRALWHDGASNSTFVCINDVDQFLVFGIVSTLGDNFESRRLVITDVQAPLNIGPRWGGPGCTVAARMVGTQFGGFRDSESTEPLAGNDRSPIPNAFVILRNVLLPHDTSAAPP